MIPELYENKYNSFIGFEIMELSSTYSKARIKCDSRLHYNLPKADRDAVVKFIEAI